MSAYANHSPAGDYAHRYGASHPHWMTPDPPSAGYVASAVVVAGGAALLLAVLTCLVTGLLYLAEIIEEHTKRTREVLRRAIQVSIGLQVLLLVVDRLPLHCIASGIAAQICYYQLLKGFPFIPLTDPKFLMSAGTLVFNHCCWMRHFMDASHSVEWICCFFFVTVWMVPFGFMLSITSVDTVLPGAANPVPKDAAGKGKGTRSAILKFFAFARDTQIIPQVMSHNNKAT